MIETPLLLSAAGHLAFRSLATASKWLCKRGTSAPAPPQPHGQQQQEEPSAFIVIICVYAVSLRKQQQQQSNQQQQIHLSSLALSWSSLQQ